MTNSRQILVDSPFGYRSTAKEVISGFDFTGKTVLITGGYSGIGLETLRAFHDAGAKIIAPARTPEKAKEALDAIGDIAQLELDLSEPDSVAKAADEIRALAPNGLDLMINNAGVMATPERRNSKGWEIQFATNHLGHFALFVRLHDLLFKTQNPRLVVLSSVAHRISDVNLDDWNFEKGEYEKWQSYGRAKSANAHFALHANALFEDKGLKAYSVHPGGIRTPLQRDLTNEEMQAMGWIDENGTPNEVFKSTEEGASTTTWAATSALLEGHGGVYCEDCNIAEMVGPEFQGFTGARDYITNSETAAKLWELSERVTGLKV